MVLIVILIACVLGAIVGLNAPMVSYTYSGYLAVIYDPSRVRAVATKNLGKSGQYLTKMAEENNALVAINGGGFDDPNHNSSGGTPLGTTIVQGEVLTDYNYLNSTGGIIGFTEDNKLFWVKCQHKKLLIWELEMQFHMVHF